MESGDAAIANAAGSSRAAPSLTGAEGAAAGDAREADVTAREALAAAGSTSRWRLSKAALLTLAAGLLITAAFALAALALYNHNETRLLRLRDRELSLVLSTAVPTLQTPLASAAELANATGGSAKKFRAFMAPLVGRGPFVRLGVAVAGRSLAPGADGRGGRRPGVWPRSPPKPGACSRRPGRAGSSC